MWLDCLVFDHRCLSAGCLSFIVRGDNGMVETTIEVDLKQEFHDDGWPSRGTELGIPPEGGYTGDTSGRLHPWEVLAPWTCESCPDPWSQFQALGPEYMGSVVTSSNAICWGDIYTHATHFEEIQIYTWPTRCRSCDTRYKKHKRTTNALVRIFRHPVRMEKVDNIWCFTRDPTYHKIKLITLTVPNTIFRLSSEPGLPVQSVLGRSLCEWTQMPDLVTEVMQQQLKEPLPAIEEEEILERTRRLWTMVCRGNLESSLSGWFDFELHSMDAWRERTRRCYCS